MILTSDPVAELERLDGQLAMARQNRVEAAARVEALDAELKRLERGRREAYADRARGTEGADERIAAIEDQIRVLEAERSQARAEAAGAKIAIGQVQEESRKLLRERREAFFEEAEKSTKDAIKAVLELEPAYRAAWTAWQTADQEWSRPAEVNDLGAVPRCPLPHPDQVFPPVERGRAPRPARIEVGS
jgi:chromosome segregation ATPase